MEKAEANPFIERTQRALQAEIPHVYVNGFANSLGTGDVLIVLEQNGNPVATVNMSYTVAKTFALALSQIVSTLESVSGREMLTTHEMEAALQKSNEPG